MSIDPARLQALLRTSTDGAPPAISDLHRLGVGRSRENWVFDAQWGNGRVDHLILRQDPPGGLVESDRAVEYAVLRALEASPLPAPRAVCLDATGAYTERPSLVMVREPGVCEYDLLGGHRPLAVRHRLARDLCRLMASVHELDWQALGLADVLDDPGDHPSLTELRRWEQTLHADQLEAYPELELALRHLAETAPPCDRPVLVHADFKPGNVLVDADNRIVALLDWELVHLGDPLEDVGWVTQPLRTREHLIPGTWERDDLLAHYAAVRGVEVPATAVTWWNVFSGFKTAVMQVSGLRSFVEGRSDDLYHPTRRVLRTLLRSLDDLTPTGAAPTEESGRLAAHPS